MSELSTACKPLVFKQAIVRAGSVDRMVSVFKSCRTEMRSLCKDIPKSSMFKCLKSKVMYSKDDTKITMQCRTSVKRVAMSMSKNAYEMPKFAKACKTSAKKFCPAELDIAVRGKQFGELIKCLVEHKDKITSPNCKSEVFAVTKDEAEDVKLNAFEQSVCAADEQTFCRDIASGSGRMHKCLRRHMQEISPECRSEEFKEEKREQSNVVIIPAIRNGCSLEIKRFCQAEKSATEKVEDLHGCLLEHLDDQEFGSACRTAMEDNEVKRSEDIRLHPLTFKRCLADERELCQLDDSKTKIAHKSYDGQIQNCMVKNFHKIKDPLCAKDVFKMVMSQINLPISLHGFKDNCMPDLRKSTGAKHPCKGLRRLELSECIITYAKDLSAECKTIVPSMKIRMSLKKDYEKKKRQASSSSAVEEEQYHGIVITGNLALLSISALILVSSVLTYYLWKKIANPGKGFTVHVTSGKGY